MAIKNTERFSELEYCISQYFSRNIAPIMTSVKSDLQEKQINEVAEYQNSSRGILGSMADASHMVPGVDTSAMTLKVIGKWNSKTTDDYLDMVRKEIAGNKAIQKDMAVIASAWRNAVIDEVGRTAYDNASRQIGSDLAYAYISHRFEEQMLDKMVSDHMPRSSMEYILRKAGENSIFGLGNILLDCPADQEISSRIEARYKPTTFEKGAARSTAFLMDAVAMGGTSSWASLAKMAGVEVVFDGMEAYASGKVKGKKQLSVEECISQGVFGSRTNVFTDFRKTADVSRTWEHPHLLSLNKQLSKKLPLYETKPMFADLSPVYNPDLRPQAFKPAYAPSGSKPSTNRDDIPFVIAPGKEEEYREDQRRVAQKKASAAAASTAPGANSSTDVPEVEENLLESEPVDENDPQVDVVSQEEGNLSGWDGLLQSFGLDGISATGHNLGYVIAMLPDVLLGTLTGKSRNFGLSDNLIPIASVLAGFFVRNPLLKMTLIGLGGANLLNKAGKESLGSQVQSVQSASEPRYKQYADEPLNTRIAGVSIQGNALVCTIDRVPCTISLPPATVDAYRAGALPLNTLANAILSRHDAMQDELALSYQQQYEHMRHQTQGAAIK